MFIVTALACLLNSSMVSGLYEKDKGKNEWRKEFIGELQDLVFIDVNKAYFVSTDGLLGLNNFMYDFVWKKQLPVVGNETY